MAANWAPSLESITIVCEILCNTQPCLQIRGEKFLEARDKWQYFVVSRAKILSLLFFFSLPFQSLSLDHIHFQSFPIRKKTGRKFSPCLSPLVLSQNSWQRTYLSSDAALSQGTKQMLTWIFVLTFFCFPEPADSSFEKSCYRNKGIILFKNWD